MIKIILREPPQAAPVPIIRFIVHRDSYKIDSTYQREAGAWNKYDEQYLIDTILRGFGMPAIFIHKRDGFNYIVDGQQRINTIWKYKDNKLPLNQEISDDIINAKENKDFNDGNPSYYYNELSEEWQDVFDSYPLLIIKLDEYSDEEVRELFKRLQRGKPLSPGEILNAYPGDIVLTMRELAGHKFFLDIINAGNTRYRHNHIAAQLMFLEDQGIKTIHPKALYEFFEKNKNLDKKNNTYKSVNRVLNYITQSFETKSPEIKGAWIITLYLLTSYLLKNYSMKDQKGNLKNFMIDFYDKISKAQLSRNQDLTDFRDAISKSTTDMRTIQLRHDIILKRFVSQYDPPLLDDQRNYTEEQKIAIYRKFKGKCQSCGFNLEYNDPDTHYHHKTMHSKGGKTTIDNGLLLCKKCHLSKYHH